MKLLQEGSSMPHHCIHLESLFDTTISCLSRPSDLTNTMENDLTALETSYFKTATPFESNRQSFIDTDPHRR